MDDAADESRALEKQVTKKKKKKKKKKLDQSVMGQQERDVMEKEKKMLEQ